MFTTEQINLSFTDPETGLQKTASVYRIEGIDRQLSIGQLVMSICLTRATTIEEEIIKLMEDMSNTTAALESLTSLEESLLTAQEGLSSGGTVGRTFEDLGFPEGTQWDGYTNWTDWLKNVVGVEIEGGPSGDVTSVAISDYVSNMEAKMDELNSFSQEAMIQLQSYTNKRDQAYDMITNVLKSFNSVLVGNANNL